MMDKNNKMIRNIEDAADHMVILLRHLLKANSIIITINGNLPDPITRVYNHENEIFNKGHDISFLENICSLIIHHGNKSLHLSKTTNHPQPNQLKYIRSKGIHSFIGVPLLFEDSRIYGTICVMHQAEDQYNDKDLIQLNALAIFFTHMIELELKSDSDEHRSQTKTELFTMLNHEIRTPMNGIVGMTDLMMTTELTVQQGYYMDIINTSNTNLMNFLDEVLDFSELDT